MSALAAVRAGGNPFLTLIEGVYMQPVEESAWSIPPFEGAAKDGAGRSTSTC